MAWVACFLNWVDCFFFLCEFFEESGSSFAGWKRHARICGRNRNRIAAFPVKGDGIFPGIGSRAKQALNRNSTLGGISIISFG
jgi:hypothetical protein